MKSRNILALLLLAAGVVMMPFAAAKADSVLYDEANFVEGQQSFTESFNITTPGTLTVSISNIAWLDVVSDLNCFVSTSKSVMNPLTNGGGTETFKVGAGAIYAHWFGSALGNYNLGVIGVKITFTPSSMPVPLPGSLILLLSGLGLLFGWQRRSQPILA
jgi:MYXO-CTERM domain-containing protein